jgi:pimeloyl-ACP methyl ester carboxylesterase
VSPSRQSERLHRDVPHSRLRLVAGAGHMVHHSEFEAVAAAVRGV